MAVAQHMNAAEMEAIAARHPDLITRSPWQRFRVAIVTGCFLLYLVFCWWFFAIGAVLGNANWGIAGSYLADWVTYEVRPNIEIADDGTMQIDYGRFSPLGDNPEPDWVTLERETVTRTIETPAAAANPSASTKPSAVTSFMAPGAAQGSTPEPQAQTQASSETVTQDVVTRALVSYDGDTSIEVADRTVTVRHDGETAVFSLSATDGVVATSPLPAWAVQKRPGEKITLSFGTTGWAEVDTDEVKIRNRFFGWANFIFDTNSPFFGKTTGEVIGLITGGERIEADRSNLSLAWNNILYNSEWQHLDVWTKLLQTIVMAFVGTLLAMIVAFPLSFIAARNITANRPLNQLTKRFFDFLRSVDMLIWALFFTRGFGPGPLAGISAIFFTDTGTLGKLYAEALENIDDKQREGVKSVGAPSLAVQRFGVLPQVMPLFASQALYFWESNTRSATIIGAVGAGGIGLKLWEAMRTNSDWENVAYMVLLILIVVFVFDNISNNLRARLMGQRNH